MSVVRRLAATSTVLLPEHKPPGSRGVILEAALRLFAERGYVGASVREIAEASGVKPATLYAHYPSKEHLLAELCRVGHEEHRRSVRAALLNSGTDPRDQVIAYVRAHVGMHTAFPMLAVVANGELHALSAELGAATFELRRQSEQVLADIVQRGVDRGVFDVPHVWLAVTAIGGMGLRVAYWYTPEYELDAEQVADVYAEYALRILGAAPLNLRRETRGDSS
ncbi:MAG: TetR family transcriptional regulator [Gammaproteobacteria bacterium]|nr:TetR family transcriptional regulator [Gammaproteobacteria bacterium]